MNSARGYRPYSNQKMRPINVRGTIGLYHDSVLIVKLPDSRILGVISKSLFLALFILALPSISSYVKDASDENLTNPDEFLPMVYKDLAAEGLFKDGQKGLVLNSGNVDLFDSFWFLTAKGIDVVTDSDLDLDLDLDRQIMIPNEMFDFVLASSFEHAEFINRVVKIDGIVVMPLGNCYDRSYEFLKQSNYKIVYLRQFDSVTVIAMRKIDGEGEESVLSG